MPEFFYLDKQRDAVAVDCHSLSFRSWDRLQASIAEVGIITPLLVRRHSNKLEIICGKGRWYCAGEDTPIPARLIVCSDRQALDYYLHDNRDRGFNAIEIARIIHRLHTHRRMTLPEISCAYAQLLGLPSGTRMLIDYLKLLRLPELVQKQISAGTLSWRSAVVLTDFTVDEAIFLTDLAVIMRYNTNKQREVFTLLWELSRSNDTNVQGILARDEFRELWQGDHPAANASQLRQRLHHMKSPALAQTMACFERILAENTTDYPIAIRPTPAFEKPDIHLEFSCRSPDSFRQALTELYRLEKNGVISALLRLGDLD